MKNIKNNKNENIIGKKSRNLLNNTFLFLIGSIGSKFIQFILVPLYTYTLTTAQYGVTEIVMTGIYILTPIFSISVSDGFLRFGLDKKYNKDTVTNIVLKILLFGSICSTLLIPLFRYSKTISEYMFFFIIILNLRIYRDIFSIRLKIMDKNKLYTVDNILYTFVLCISNFILLVFFRQEIRGYFWSYIIANIFSIIFICVISRFSIKILFEKIDKKLLKKIIIYSLPMIANGIAWWVTNASDKFMLNWFMTESDVGIYSISAKLPTFVTTFITIFNQAWIISSVIEFDNEKEKSFYANTFRKYYGLLFISCSLLICIIKPFIKIYVSPEYNIAWKYAPILIASTSSSGIAEFTVGIYAASMKNVNVTITTVIGGVVNIILNYLLIPKIGIMGATVATYISWSVVAIIRMIDIRKFFAFNIDYKKILTYAILLAIQSIGMTFLNNILGQLLSILIVLIFIFMERQIIILIIKLIQSKLKKRSNEI